MLSDINGKIYIANFVMRLFVANVHLREQCILSQIHKKEFALNAIKE